MVFTDEWIKGSTDGLDEGANIGRAANALADRQNVSQDNGAREKPARTYWEIGTPFAEDFLFSDFAPVEPAQLSLSDGEAPVFQECCGRDSLPSSVPGRGSGQSPYSSDPLL